MSKFFRSKPPKLLLPHQCSTLEVEEKVPSNHADDGRDDYDDSNGGRGNHDAQNYVHYTEEILDRW